MRLKALGTVAAGERNVRDESLIPMQGRHVRDASSFCRVIFPSRGVMQAVAPSAILAGGVGDLARHSEISHLGTMRG
jgi:hypothetical protein